MPNKITTQKKKERSQELSEIVRKIQYKKNEEWIGWEGEVIVLHDTPTSKKLARNIYYKPVILMNGNLGERVIVKINEVTNTTLRGKIILKATASKKDKKGLQSQ